MNKKKTNLAVTLSCGADCGNGYHSEKSNLLSAQTKDLFSVQSIKSPTKVTKI